MWASLLLEAASRLPLRSRRTPAACSMLQTLIRLQFMAVPCRIRRRCHRARCLTAQSLAGGRSRAQAGMATPMLGMWTGTNLGRDQAGWPPWPVRYAMGLPMPHLWSLMSSLRVRHQVSEAAQQMHSAPQCDSLFAGEGLRKGLRDMQQHATRQAAGKREPEESGGPESAAASHPDMEHNLKRPDMTQRDPGGNTFLQSLKARYATLSLPEEIA